VQAWVALPEADAEMAPAFAHHGAGELPLLEEDGARVRVIAGTLGGAASPAVTRSPLFYAEASLAAGARVALPREHDERAFYVFSGAVEVEGDAARYDAGRLVVVRPGAATVVRAPEAPARVMLLGGAPLDGPRIVWWNFVASSRERIEAAKEDWQARRFPGVPGDDAEFIPLPAERPVPDVNYP
jgi:redox-sensitive bicupin YhaK (pirin superfamily)